MRYKPDHKSKTHERIVQTAADLFREHGYNATGVKTVMEESGLTVGGFYSHFESKEALLREALERILPLTQSLIRDGLDDVTGAEYVAAVAERYLSKAHRDNPQAGCPLPALTSEVPRVGPEAQRTFEQLFVTILDELEAKVPPGPGVTPRERALGFMSLCAGALMISRALHSEALSDEMLDVAARMAVPELHQEP